MDASSDFFSLFHLPRAFRLDRAALDLCYREVQQVVHPDRFAAASEQEKRLSVQWAARANEAYQTLKQPLSRAVYLLSLAGQAVDAERHTAMDPAFLMEQMEWREAVQEAKRGGDQQTLEQLHRRLAQAMTDRYEELAVLLDDRKDYPVAADAVRRLMFQEKLLGEIDDALAALYD